MADYAGCYALADRLLTWGRVRVENGHSIDFVQNSAVITKSCLFMRVVHEGKEPLPFPPPTYMSAPWYDLIDNGESELREFDVSLHEQARGVIVIGQCTWGIIDRRNDGSFIVRFSKMPEGETWSLTPCKVPYKRYEAGKPVHIYEGDGWTLKRNTTASHANDPATTLVRPVEGEGGGL